jgi:hypothetical protein
MIESPAPAIGNATPKFAPAVSINKAMQQQAQQPIQQNPPPSAEPSNDARPAPTPEEIKGYGAKIDKIFGPKHFGKLIAPAIRNSIRKVLKEQLPNLDYRDPGFIRKFEEACGKVDKAASRAAGEFSIILEEYKAAVGSLAGINVESGVLADE